MDVLGVNNSMKSPKQSKRSRSKAVKVVYISSPMKVKTSASKFRALVQELTGQDSDAERFMETNGGHHNNHQHVHEFAPHEHPLKHNSDDDDDDLQLPFSNSFYEFPNCSVSLFEPLNGHFELDVLRSFDQV